MSSDPPNEDQPQDDPSKSNKKKKEDSLTPAEISNPVLPLFDPITELWNRSVYSLCAAVLLYTDNSFTNLCSFTSPSLLLSAHSSSSRFSINVRNTSVSGKPKNPSKRQQIERMDSAFQSNTLLETDLLLQVRRRTFSHWPHRTIPSTAQMTEAGFFSCNVGDQVICIYCNLICQQWTPHTDDPCEVHKTLSPNCPFVKMKLIRPAASSIIIGNESSTSVASSNHALTSNRLDPLRSNKIVHTAACNSAYAEIPKRRASFATWPTENLPFVHDLVRAGFFYTGTNTIVTCFYCKGSLQNWGPDDNPMIEHARWFPQCAYAKQLCGDDLYRKIQAAKRTQEEDARANEFRENLASGILPSTDSTAKSRQLLTPDESTLSRLVAARLDLPISQCLLDQNVKLSIIRRCWEDQLRLKQDDVVSELDLFIACLISQKQIEHIDGEKENIVIPSIKMNQVREQAEKERNGTCSTEIRNKTIEREKSFRLWLYSSQSRMNMFAAGWLFDNTIAADYTVCPYCDVSYDSWQPEDNPWLIHRQLSPFCPFLLSSHPMHPSSVPIKRLQDVLTPEKIANKAAQPMSDVILTSDSLYRLPPKRHESFSKFPNGSPENIEALYRAGFYYTGTGTNIRCYTCLGVASDFHNYPSNEIDTLHRTRFPRCHFAQLLPQQGEARATNNANLCEWCLVNPKVLAIYPCEHLAVCELCAQMTNTCPICGIEAEAFIKLYF